MARIVVVSFERRRETRTFSILSRALRSHGHEVVEVGQDGGGAPTRFAELMARCNDADLLIASPDTVSASAARASGVPMLCVVLEPASLAHVDYRPLVSPPPRGRLRVLASSAHFTVPDFSLYEDLRVTGFLFDDSVCEMSRPAESGPIVLCVGGLPIAGEAAALVGCRLLMESEPDATLYSHATAVIHDGAIATTAEVLRAGKPMVVLPQLQSEYFNARAVLRLGVGAAMRREGIQAVSLARVLEKLIGSKETLDRAADIARKLKTDNGLGAVCTLVESILRVERGL